MRRIEDAAAAVGLLAMQTREQIFVARDSFAESTLYSQVASGIMRCVARVRPAAAQQRNAVCGEVVCPEDWVQLDGFSCAPPPSYHGPCRRKRVRSALRIKLNTYS